MSKPNLRRKAPGATQSKDASEQHQERRLVLTQSRLRDSKWSSFSRLLAISILLGATFSLVHRMRLMEPKTALDIYALCSNDTASIYTVDESNTVVQCLLVCDATILYTGSLAGANQYWKSELNDTSGKTPLDVRYLPRDAIVVPGMSDSHGHIIEYGASRLLQLDGSKDSSEIVSRVRSHVLSHPDVLKDSSRFIEGWGWDHTSWPVEKFPSYEDLEKDPVLQGRPIILQSKDGHAQWVSKTILEGTLPLPDSIEGGLILRDEKGNASGVFLDKAQDLIRRPALTHADELLRFDRTIKDALSKGLTSLHDAGFNPASLEFFKRQSELGDLPIRIFAMRYFNENTEYWGDKTEKIIDHNRLTSRSVKMFADGALRSGGAALFESYSDNPSTSGFMRIDPSILSEFVPKFMKDGWQVNVHAIGDRANSIVLDVIESAMKTGLNGTQENSLRPRVEHAQIILPEDAARLAKLGVIASVQPTHAISDMWYAQERLGPKRIKNLYAFRTLIGSGARITLGSDFPVEDMNPLAGFHAAITRVSPDGRSPHGPAGWFPEQCLTRIEALRGFTIDPAYASFTEGKLGSLEPGKIADYTILSQDIMTIPVDKLLETKVIATALDGKIVYGSIV